MLNVELSFKSPDYGKLIIYDLIGREIKVLHNGPFLVGTQEFNWDGRLSSGNYAQSGMYLCTLISSKVTYSVTLMRLE